MSVILLALSLLLSIVSQNVAQDTSPPAIVVHPPKFSKATIGKTVRMSCVAYGNPTPSITWSRLSADIDEKLSDTDSGYTVFEQTNTVDGVTFRISVLEICGATVDDTDEFFCTADNGVLGDGIGNAEEGFFLSVSDIIPEPPAIVVRPAPDTTVEYGSSLEAVCIAYGDPLPTITWTLNDGCADLSCSANARIFSEIVKFGDVSYKKSVLQFCNIEESDSGRYKCTASNGVPGEGLAPNSHEWQLTVKPKPFTPAPVTTTTASTKATTTSTVCPNDAATTNTRMVTVTASPTSNVNRTTGQAKQDNLDGKTGHQAAVGVEAVIIVIIIIVIVIAVILIVQSQSKAKNKSKYYERHDEFQPHAFSTKAANE